MTLPSWELLGQSILSGVFIGALYGLLGLGLSLSWGMLNQINLAHFALAFLGAYLTFQMSSVGGMDPLLTLLIIALVGFVFGLVIVRVPGVAFGMLTLAIGQMFFLSASRARGITGGADGMNIDWPSNLFGLPVSQLLKPASMFLLCWSQFCRDGGRGVSENYL